MMAGALSVLNEAGATLIGGHTSEGPELALGFSVNGLADPDTILRKGGMLAGDVLIVTKPLGTGTLFAADMRLKAKGRWIEGALECMIQSNREAAKCLFSFGAKACTDITGFGLLGHLLEMTKASGVDIQLKLDALPVLDGAQETINLGILSSLQPANLRLRRAIRNQSEAREHERYPLIFDPQTSGGLLASLPADQAVPCLETLHGLGYTEAAIVGNVAEESDHLEPIILN
jgi:selenide,water dikinase